MKSKYIIKNGYVYGLKLKLNPLESITIITALQELINNEERNMGDRIAAEKIKNEIIASLSKKSKKEKINESKSRR